MAEVSLPNARRDQDNTFTGKNRFKQRIVADIGASVTGTLDVNAGATGKGLAITSTAANKSNLIDASIDGVTALSLVTDTNNIVKTLELMPGANAQGVFASCAGRFRAGYDGGNAFVDSVNKEVQIRSGNVPNVRVGPSATLGFFNAAPVAKPALTYSRAVENAAQTQLRTALAALGLVTDSTVA